MYSTSLLRLCLAAATPGTRQVSMCWAEIKLFYYLPWAFGFIWWGEFTQYCCLRPYHLEYTSSRPITEVKQGWAVLVLGWVTAWEHRVPLSLFPPAHIVKHVHALVFAILGITITTDNNSDQVKLDRIKWLTSDRQSVVIKAAVLTTPNRQGTVRSSRLRLRLRFRFRLRLG